MADDRMAALELLRKAAGDGDLDFLREGLTMLTQLVMDAEVSAQIGADHGERAPERRLTQRNGYRERRWDTRVGTIELQIPKLRDGTYFPSLLEPRRRAERALLSVVQEAYVGGVSTRRVEELVAALGVTNLSKSEVSRICAGLDAEVDAFRSRPLDPAGYPYVSLDALYHKVREGGRVVSMATLIAIGISATGQRSVLGVEVAATGGDEGAHWLPFLRSLTARGLVGVRLVISDAHPGLVAAVEATFLGAAWQRSSVHSEAGPLVPVSHRAESALAAAIGFRSSGRPAPPLGRRAYTGPRETCLEHRTMSVPGGLRRAARRTVEAGGQHLGGLRRARLGRAASPGPCTRRRGCDPALGPSAARPVRAGAPAGCAGGARRATRGGCRDRTA